MTLKEGRRVKLAADTRLTDSGAVAGGGFLALAAGTEGTVEQVVEHRNESQEVREYVRLKSLLDDFGHQMPTESRRQLVEKVGALEPEWIAYQQQGQRVTVRVRFDNGFILDEVQADLFTTA
ncbi:hypothetical protein [Streptomyces sp. NPDC051211]|uniref:hypothetical protein n=1 Tax=Streptomyces sp. NPDC051211 TaxID=3154643 RepID=UPI00344C08BF